MFRGRTKGAEGVLGEVGPEGVTTVRRPDALPIRRCGEHQADCGRWQDLPRLRARGQFGVTLAYPQDLVQASEGVTGPCT